jgi:methylated-DNA-[protein]-cysteine S-methyltransferase
MQQCTSGKVSILFNRSLTMNKSADSLYTYCSSPIGELLLLSDGDALTGLVLAERDGTPARPPEPGRRSDDAAFRVASDQLRAYFAGELRRFDLPLRLTGTPYQRLAWEGLLSIPFGCTISYAEQARRIGRPGAARAVGAANGRNPIAIIVPCHRVIGANGTLTGYGGGLERKEWLIAHEASIRDRGDDLFPQPRKVATRLAKV